jgi:hypothetical protein
VYVCVCVCSSGAAVVLGWTRRDNLSDVSLEMANHLIRVFPSAYKQRALPCPNDDLADSVVAVPPLAKHGMRVPCKQVVVRKLVLEGAAEVSGEQCHRSESVIVWLSFTGQPVASNETQLHCRVLFSCQEWVYAVEPKRNSPL